MFKALDAVSIASESESPAAAVDPPPWTQRARVTGTAASLAALLAAASIGAALDSGRFAFVTSVTLFGGVLLSSLYAFFALSLRRSTQFRRAALVAIGFAVSLTASFLVQHRVDADHERLFLRCIDDECAELLEPFARGRALEALSPDGRAALLDGLDSKLERSGVNARVEINDSDGRTRLRITRGGGWLPRESLEFPPRAVGRRVEVGGLTWSLRSIEF